MVDGRVESSNYRNKKSKVLTFRLIIHKFTLTSTLLTGCPLNTRPIDTVNYIQYIFGNGQYTNLIQLGFDLENKIIMIARNCLTHNWG